MRYALLLHQDEAVWERAGPDERRRYLDEHRRFADAAEALDVTIVAGEALCSVATATTVRRRGDQLTVADGPATATVEQLGGFYVVEAPSLDDVLEAVRVLPEYSIEVRPVADLR